MLSHSSVGFIVLLAIVLSAPLLPAQEPAPPNFLFIAVDDLNAYNSVLGDHPNNFLRMVYKDPAVRQKVVERLTPNLKRFAGRALTFRNAYTPYPLCGPSRTALLTGVPPHVSGYYDHRKHFRHSASLAQTTTLPEYLKEQGYYTAGLGKIFHKGHSHLDREVFSDWPDRLFSWSDWVEVHAGTGATKAANVREKQKISKFWEPQGRSEFHYSRFGVTELPRELSNDYVNADFTGKLLIEGKASIVDMHGKKRTLQLPAEQPFFLACGFFAPHLPWVANQKYFDLFPESEMDIDRELLEWVLEDLKDLPNWSRNRTGPDNIFREMLAYGIEQVGPDGDLAAWREFFRSYLATIAYSDENIGHLLDLAAQSPRANNTIIILWSDHGYHIGDKAREGKITLWDAANHCNLMIFDPSRKGASSGQATEILASLQDLYPTVVSLAGLPRPDHVHGDDLTPLLENPALQWERPILNTFLEGNHAVRTDRYRYIRYRDGGEELYDLQEDPLEESNLAGQAKVTELQATLARQLDELLTRKSSRK
ncbi:sulfatase [Neolewinella lacunae]|uniref:Sulfatase n=1 Tax=Neolewinella lacunae TaxID=1517758 RepID=A0A923PJ36_9BACT|nr:sulfatase [Neolewinella lacunae]MBC6994244.1 sulfatase [Neolewinella lacunae]MDN3637138.1 sulfatase [Neolewinella lacunae]